MTEQATKAGLAERLVARFGDTVAHVSGVCGETTIEVAPADLLAVCAALRDEPDFRFASIIDVCGVDYLGYGKVEWDTTDVTSEGFSRGVQGLAAGRFAWEERPTETEASIPNRFASVIHLLSLEHNERLRIRTYCEDDTYPVVPSITGLWNGANWFERESFDLFGIIDEGHAVLRRILPDYGFVGLPFR